MPTCVRIRASGGATPAEDFEGVEPAAASAIRPPCASPDAVAPELPAEVV